MTAWSCVYSWCSSSDATPYMATRDYGTIDLQLHLPVTCALMYTVIMHSLSTILQSKMKNGPQRGSIRLSQARVAVVHDDQLSFTVHSHTKKILLKGFPVNTTAGYVYMVSAPACTIELCYHSKGPLKKGFVYA